MAHGFAKHSSTSVNQRKKFKYLINISSILIQFIFLSTYDFYDKDLQCYRHILRSLTLLILQKICKEIRIEYLSFNFKEGTQIHKY